MTFTTLAILVYKTLYIPQLGFEQLQDIHNRLIGS